MYSNLDNDGSRIHSITITFTMIGMPDPDLLIKFEPDPDHKILLMLQVLKESKVSLLRRIKQKLSPRPSPPETRPPVADSRHPLLQKSVTRLPVSIDDRPPQPLPPVFPRPAYPVSNYQLFMNDSGWYSPTLNDVMSRKLQRPLKYFKYGVILFQHKLRKNKVYAQKHKETDDNILKIISCLFSKQDEELKKNLE